MYENVDINNEKQKPPLSVGRIVCEILTGLALGFILLLIVYVTGTRNLVDSYGLVRQDSAFVFLMIFTVIFPFLYGFGSAVGVYLVGTRGKQTGSFLLALAGGFVGALVVVLPSFSVFTSGKVKLYKEPLLFLLLIPPFVATLAFNLTRRYKKPKPPIH